MPHPRLLAVAGTVLLAVVTTLVPVLSSQAAPAALAAVCNRYCDVRDPALSPGDREGAATTLFGRRIALHLNDTDAMGWASVNGGQPGDEVWLDRSFDGGRSWGSGSRLGATRIPAGSAGWRTMMFNNDDWAARGIGALRACAKPHDRSGIACTVWARTTWNAYDGRTAAATGLMQYYRNDTGLFGTRTRRLPRRTSTRTVSSGIRGRRRVAAAPTGRRSRVRTSGGWRRSTRCSPTGRTPPTCAGRPTRRTPKIAARSTRTGCCGPVRGTSPTRPASRARST